MYKFICFLLLIISVPVFSDQPPGWGEFVVHSENMKWTAVVKRQGKSSKPWHDSWDLEVYEGFYYPGVYPDAKPHWSRSYTHSGYSGGILSNDGLAFSHVSFWYYADHSVVSIYRKNCTIHKPGSYFELVGSLEKTSSHELWLKQGGSIHFSSTEDRLFLKLDTVQGPRMVAATCNSDD